MWQIPRERRSIFVEKVDKTVLWECRRVVSRVTLLWVEVYTFGHINIPLTNAGYKRPDQ